MSGYSGGGASLHKKTLKSWIPRAGSAKKDIEENLQLLRARARDLALNSPVGAAIINSLVSGTIGSGLKLFPRIKAKALNISNDDARIWSRRVKNEFNLWANNPLNCDFLRRNNFYEMQSIAFRAMLTDGDSFVLFKRKNPAPHAPYSLRLQIINALRVSNPTLNLAGNQIEMLMGNNKIVNGIEVDRHGVMVAVWIANRVWDEFDALEPALKWQRVRWFGNASGCRNVLHICRDEVPDQFRGTPVLSKVIESLKQLSRYADAELSSAIIKSFFSIFFIQKDRDYTFNQITGQENREPLDVSEFKLGDPSVTSLPVGVDVKAVDSSKTQDTFQSFTDSFLKQICAACNLPAEIVLKEFNASYSASRAAILQSQEEFRTRRENFIVDFLQPVYELFLTEAVATGRITAPSFFEDPLTRQLWLNAEWLSETSHTLDPVKEAQASILRIKNGLSTYKKEIATSSGRDFDDICEEIREERQELSDCGFDSLQ